MVREKKVKEVEELKEMIEKYKVVGIIDLFKMPSKQLQEIKKKIRNEALIKACKRSLLNFALEKVNKDKIKELGKDLPYQPALILTNQEPFKFYALVSKLKSPTSAKEGDIIPINIKVSAGPTKLLPGPVISELSKVGIPAGVEEGKIAIKKDVVVAKKGDVVSKPLANVLQKLEIEPIEVGLNVVVMYDNGLMYTKEVLDLVNSYPQKLTEAFNCALNLSVSIEYPTKENIKFLLVKAFNSAKVIESKIGGVS